VYRHEWKWASRRCLFLAAATSIVVFGALGTAHGASPQSASFSLKGSNGFALDVTGEGGEVTVIASERRPPVATFAPSGRPRSAGTGNGASNIYSVPARAAGPGAVDAGLGSLGRIAVRFQPSGRSVVSVARVCGRTDRVVRRLGVFVGTIRFEGEDGYTTVAATSARGSVGTPLPADCGAVRSGPGRAVAFSGSTRAPLTGSVPRGAVLSALNPGTGSSFRAAPGVGGVSFSARVEEETADGVTVVRHAQAGAPASAFDFNRALTRAAVRPPAPFSGSAHFDAAAAIRWAGSLRVTFPGLSVPLTGPDFQSRLRRP
jgi:hypothetical protein